MKKYIKVNAVFDTIGNVIPNYIVWDNNKKYPIEDIYDIRYFEPENETRYGIRYVCLIQGKPRCLYYLNNRWYVELILSSNKAH